MDLLTIGETATALHVHPATVRRLIAKGSLHAVHVGKSVRVPRRAIEALTGDPQLTEHVSAELAGALAPLNQRLDNLADLISLLRQEVAA